jgi:hypothetical protein
MAKFIQIGQDNFINIDKIIRITKVEGRNHPSKEGKYQHKVLGSDGDYHWVGEYTSSIQWVIYTTQEWDGIYRVTDSTYFERIKDILKATCSNIVL